MDAITNGQDQGKAVGNWVLQRIYGEVYTTSTPGMQDQSDFQARGREPFHD